MGIFDRISTGWSLGKQSIRVVWNDKTLMVFPVLSGIATLAALAGFYFGIGPEQFELLMQSQDNPEAIDEISPLSYALAILSYFVAAFITIFFNVALVGCAHISMEHRDSKLSDGLRVAFAHLGSILVWSAITGTVGMVLSALENDKRVGRVVQSVLGTAWAVITYFVIPVMVLEKTNAFSAVSRSTKLMVQTWGENLGARFGLGWILLLLNLPTIALIAVGIFAGPRAAMVCIPIAILYGAFTAILSQSAKSVLTVVLYKYATSGNVPDGFDDGLIQHAFERR